jgi:predicted O-methyltransferase YrrM
MPNYYQARQCFKYLLETKFQKNQEQYSDFLSNFIANGLNTNDNLHLIPEVEKLLKKLKKHHLTIKINDLGAGSKKMKSQNRKISKIARYSIIPLKYRLLITKIFKYFEVDNALELGTSLGITTAYLANASKKGVTSIEGDSNLYKLAQQNLNFLNIKNVNLINSEFSSALENMKQKFDAILIDGNHTYKATMKYFHKLTRDNCTEKSILIFDDIYWSEGMAKAWQEIKEASKISLTLDFCKLGIAFLNPNLPKQNITIFY